MSGDDVLTVTLTADDVRQGEKYGFDRWPLAYAASRALDTPGVALSGRGYIYVPAKRPGPSWAPIGPDAVDFIRWFHRASQVDLRQALDAWTDRVFRFQRV